MHIWYVGLPASATLETEAALQLLRLQSFGSFSPTVNLPSKDRAGLVVVLRALRLQPLIAG